MASLGATRIRAWLGPSICGACYEVPAALRDEVAAAVPATRSRTSWGTPALDLPAGARSQLEAAGVDVEYTGGCTLETETLYSYRRNPTTGRFAGLLWCHD
jgi:copper oxidase (laccase) domain-containing protein